MGLLLVAFFMIAYYRVPGILAVHGPRLLHDAHLRDLPAHPGDAHSRGHRRIHPLDRYGGRRERADLRATEGRVRSGKSLRVAVEEGRKRAFPSIFYSNLATVLTAGILFMFGTGTVKGFALTLGIGVGVSFFTAVVVTQMLLHGSSSSRHSSALAVRRRGTSRGAAA